MRQAWWTAAIAMLALGLTTPALASVGDRLPQFTECLEICQEANCRTKPTSIPFHRRLLLWTCPSECDYACQQLTTDARLSPTYTPTDTHTPVQQFHGKWPFLRFLGIQEPFSVLFSLLNYLAHIWGLAQIRDKIPPSYTLRKYYMAFGFFGLASWIASMVFHTRDFVATERADYFAAGASVMYGLYYTPIRIFRLDLPPHGASHASRSGTSTPAHVEKSDGGAGLSSLAERNYNRTVVHLWTVFCLALYGAHVAYLTLWRWDYTYNMGANIAVGVVQNVLWTGFSLGRYRASGRGWTAWPGMIVAWVVLAMSLEVLDFPPIGRFVDAHSLWHLLTVGPTIWWYRFLIKDSQDDRQHGEVERGRPTSGGVKKY